MKHTGYLLWINDELSWLPTLPKAEGWARMAEVFGYDIVIRGVETGVVLYPLSGPAPHSSGVKGKTKSGMLKARRAAWPSSDQ